MPELPEVETVRNVLKERIINKQILDIDIYFDKIIDMNREEFLKDTRNQIIKDIKRRGKWLMIELDKFYLMCHLRMEGKFFFKEKNDILEKHEHVVIRFTDETELRYHDTRKFGKMFLVEKGKEKDNKPLSELGLEPFDDNLTVSYLKNKFNNKNIPIKSILLDQSIIAGIGNIYADEILFLSQINPKGKAKDVTNKELVLLIKNLREVMEKAINEGGTTIRSYTSSLGVTGRFQSNLNVYKQEGKVCNVCGSEIKKIVVGGRGTSYCPVCQKR